VVSLLCLPGALLLSRQLDLTGGGPLDPVSLWRSFTPLEKLGNLFSIWFMSLGLMGLTQAVSTLAAWDVCTESQTSLGNLADRLFQRVHRIVGLQLFVILMAIILVPLSVFAIPAILLDNCGVFKGIAKSTEVLSRHAGKTILILLSALVVAIAWRLGVGLMVAPYGQSLLVSAFAIEMKMAMFYIAEIVIGIPTTLIYCQSRDPLQPPAQRQSTTVS
jgi:hypothetical protein